MRLLRAGFGSIAIVIGLLFAAAPASARIDQISLGTPQLGPRGITVVVPLTVTCDTDFNIAFGDVNIVQASGHKLAQGTGSFVNDFPGVPCTGSPQSVSVTVPSTSSFTLKQGNAFASADVTVFNPVTFDFITEFAPQQSVRLRK